MPQVAVLGLDAAEWSFIEPLLQDGQLPNLAALRDRSSECRLENNEAYHYGQVFSQFLYGTKATTHSDWDPLFFDANTYEASQQSAALHAKRTPFFRLNPATRSIAFDVPSLCLGSDNNGVEVTAWGASAPLYPRASHPAGLLRDIDDMFGPHPACQNDYECGWHDPERVDALVGALEVGARRRVEIAKSLQDRFPWDLFLTVMSETHSGAEYLWHGVDSSHPLHHFPGTEAAADQLRRVYVAIDESIGLFVRGLPESTYVIVFSLYGAKGSPGDTPSLVLLPELLHRLHFGKTLQGRQDTSAWQASGCPPVAPAPGQHWAEAVEQFWEGTAKTDTRSPGRFLRSGLRIWDHRASLGALVRDKLERGRPGVFGIEIPAETHLDREQLLTSRRFDSLEWQFVGHYQKFRPSMRAFALPSFSDGLIRINLKGRERDGLVEPDNYDRTCQDLEAELRSCRNPRNGKPAVDEVVRLRAPADILDPGGPYADLAVRWSSPLDALEHPAHGIIGPFPLRRTAEHTPDGFAMIAGPGIIRRDFGVRSALDLPPTILSLLGQEVPSSMDGEAIQCTDTAGQDSR